MGTKPRIDRSPLCPSCVPCAASDRCSSSTSLPPSAAISRRAWISEPFWWGPGRWIGRSAGSSSDQAWTVGSPKPGASPGQKIRELLQRCDVYLAPATLESFGIAALEARSAGLPVIGMAGGGISDFIEHGVEGSWSTLTLPWRPTRPDCSPRPSSSPGFSTTTAATIRRSAGPGLELHEAVYAAAHCSYRDTQPIGHPLDFADVGRDRRDADPVLDWSSVDSTTSLGTLSSRSSRGHRGSPG